MTNHNPGVSSHSPEEWEGIRRFFVKLYVEHGLSLKDTQRHLEVRLAFIATDNEFKNRIRGNWKECLKNSTAVSQGSRRIRGKASKNPDYPPYAQLNPNPRFPIRINETTSLDNDITLLLKRIDRYTQAFYDFNPSQATSVREGGLDAGWKKWHHMLALCQEISLFPQKKKDVILFTSISDNTKDKGKVKMKNMVTRLLRDHAFSLLDGIESVTTPRDLPTFWSICRVLHGLTCQLSHTDGLISLLTRQFVRKLHGLFGNIQDGPTTILHQAFGHLLHVPPSEIKELISIGSHFSARILSSRLGPYDPDVLQASADQYQHWDRITVDKNVFLRHYDIAYECAKAQSKKENGWPFSEKTLAVLIPYCYTTHYIFHDVDLALILSTELWSQTGAMSIKIPRWSVRLQGMVEAAKIQALLCYINHEDKVKSRAELQKKKRMIGLYTKPGRRTYRKQVQRSLQQDHQLGDLPPYSLEQQVKFGLHEIVQEMITQDDESYLLFVTDLHELLESLWNTDLKSTSNLLAAVEILDWTKDKECRLLSARLHDMLTFLTQAVAQDIRTVRNSAGWLKTKVGNASAREISWNNLTNFLREEEERINIKGKEYREVAKHHRLTVAYGTDGAEIYT